MSVFPPRAKYVTSVDEICNYKHGWLSEPKLNGTALIVLCVGGRITTMNRHDKIYSTEISDAEYLSILPNSKDWILCGEYLNKGQEDETGTVLKGKFVIWDIINYDGVNLIGKTLNDRMALLMTNAKNPIRSKKLKGAKNKTKRPYIQCEYTENIWLIEICIKHEDFMKMYKLSTIPVVEGLVLKRGTAKLEPFHKSDNNITWQAKIRKPTKCYKR